MYIGTVLTKMSPKINIGIRTLSGGNLFLTYNFQKQNTIDRKRKPNRKYQPAIFKSVLQEEEGYKNAFRRLYL